MSHYELKELKQANQLMREGKINEAFEIVLEFEKRGDLSNRDLLSCILLKAKLFWRSGIISDSTSNLERAFKCANQVLGESQKQGDSFSFLDGLLIQAHSLMMMGDLSQANTILKQAQEVFENLKRVSKIDLRETESLMIRTKAVINGLKGNIPLCIKLNERALELVKDSDDKSLIITCLLNLTEDYHALGDYDKAITYAKRAIEVHYPSWLFKSFGYLIEILLSKSDVVNAKFYFQQMGGVKEKYKSKRDNLVYRYYEALILKTSLRARNRIKAEEIFKQIVEEEEDSEFRNKALINLCDLLLIELSMTNDSDVIDEINPYVTMLLNLAEQQHPFFTYYFAPETYLLQGKLYLLTFNLKKAKRFLTQALQVANRYGFTELVTKIIKENDDLLKNEDLWNKLKEEDAPMADRVALARLEEQIEGMVRNPKLLTTYIKEERVTITKETKICLVCRTGALKFTYICECGAIYCENCARALSNLENVCWSCEAPIDTSKPIKPYKEEKPIISEKDVKK